MAPSEGGSPPIRLRRVYDTPRSEDGMRVLVDRLWPRGLRRELAQVERRAPELAPSADLRRWFGHDPRRFSEFRARYLDELDNRADEMEALLGEARGRPLTLLFAARDRDHNHAAILADALGEISGREVVSDA